MMCFDNRVGGTCAIASVRNRIEPRWPARVLVTSAVPLPDDQAERLRQEIRSQFAKEPVLDIHVDPELIAGMLVRVGDWRLDSSIRSRLHRIREQLVERSSYEIQSRRDRFSSPE